MKKLLFATAALSMLVVAVPASAQVFLGADSSGAGVQVGPLGIGVGPRFSGYYGDGYAYAPDCPLVRERIVTPSGRVIFKTKRTC